MVVDEAYADFANDSAIRLLSDAENIIVTRTFSKSYSLAGSRVGYAVASPDLVKVLDSVREVYNLDRMSQAAAYAALKDQEYFEKCLQKSLMKDNGLMNFYFARLANN